MLKGFCVALLGGLFLAPVLGQGAALEGFYRIEGVGVNAASSFRDFTVYGAQQLTLQPSIVASDGLFVEGRIHVLNSQSLSWPQIRPSNAGGTEAGGEFRAGQSTLRRPWLSQWGQLLGHEESLGDAVQVAELYASFDHGRGLLSLGRQALPFGLGLLYHGGRGARDHWYKTYDMLAYRLQWGRLSLRPMLALEPEALHYIVQLDYSHENNFQASLLYKKYAGQVRSKVVPSLVTTPVVQPQMDSAEGGAVQPAAAQPQVAQPQAARPQQTAQTFNQNSISAYYEKSLAPFKLQVEGHYVKGTRPVQVYEWQVAKGEAVLDQNAFAFAARGEWTKTVWTAGLDVGFARGDKMDTKEFEAFIVNPNYDPTLLMFNYAATRGELKMAQPAEGQGSQGAQLVQQQKHLDVGVLTDAVYVAPYIKRSLGRSWASQLGAAVGWRAQEFSYMGFEVNGGLQYAPHPRFSWSTRLGVMMLGSQLQTDSSLVYAARSSLVVGF